MRQVGAACPELQGVMLFYAALLLAGCPTLWRFRWSPRPAWHAVPVCIPHAQLAPHHLLHTACTQAPYSRDLPGLFFGEELLQLQRMWCAGWDVYTPPTAVAFHLWSRQHRPTFRDEQRADSAEQQRRSQHRVVAALSGEGEGPGGDGGSSSGCGVRPWRRSLERFWKHVGVDFRPGSRAISNRARNGGWPAEAFLTLDSCTLQP